MVEPVLTAMQLSDALSDLATWQ